MRSPWGGKPCSPPFLRLKGSASGSQMAPSKRRSAPLRELGVGRERERDPAIETGGGEVDLRPAAQCRQGSLDQARAETASLLPFEGRTAILLPAEVEHSDGAGRLEGPDHRNGSGRV